MASADSDDDSTVKMSRLLRLAQKFNCFYLTGLSKGDCRPFVVDGKQVGVIRPDVLRQLALYPDVFCLRSASSSSNDNRTSSSLAAGGRQEVVELNPAFRDYAERSARVDEVLRKFRQEQTFVTLKGWRDEFYDVKSGSHSLFKMDRSATCLFGIRNYGVTLNGFVRHPDRGLCIWFQQRADNKQTWPGKWDNMVSGGLSVGYGITETAVKEAAEEASVPASLVTGLVPAGCVSFLFESERGIFPNTEFVFDLELPIDFVPTNADGEVQAFELLPADQCLEKVFSPDFKTTSCPVVLDFLIRRGVITAENEPNFTQIVELLHVPLQSLYQAKFRCDDASGEPAPVVLKNGHNVVLN